MPGLAVIEPGFGAPGLSVTEVPRRARIAAVRLESGSIGSATIVCPTAPPCTGSGALADGSGMGEDARCRCFIAALPLVGTHMAVIHVFEGLARSGTPYSRVAISLTLVNSRAANLADAFRRALANAPVRHLIFVYCKVHNTPCVAQIRRLAICLVNNNSLYCCTNRKYAVVKV
jgi:hypothetical protein